MPKRTLNNHLIIASKTFLPYILKTRYLNHEEIVKCLSKHPSRDVTKKEEIYIFLLLARAMEECDSDYSQNVPK